MAALGPVERARFLSRVLGYERLRAAQEMLREQRRTAGRGAERPAQRHAGRRASVTRARRRRETALAPRHATGASSPSGRSPTAEARLGAATPRVGGGASARGNSGRRWRPTGACSSETLLARVARRDRVQAELREVARRVPRSRRCSTPPCGSPSAARRSSSSSSRWRAAEGERRALVERLQGAPSRSERALARAPGEARIGTGAGAGAARDAGGAARRRSGRPSRRTRKHARSGCAIGRRPRRDSRRCACSTRSCAAQQDDAAGAGRGEPVSHLWPSARRVLPGGARRWSRSSSRPSRWTAATSGSACEQLATPRRSACANSTARATRCSRRWTSRERRLPQASRPACRSGSSSVPQLAAVRQRAQASQHALEAAPRRVRRRAAPDGARRTSRACSELATRAAPLETRWRVSRRWQRSGCRRRERELADAARAKRRCWRSLGGLAFDPAAPRDAAPGVSRRPWRDGSGAEVAATAGHARAVERATQERDTAARRACHARALRARAGLLEAERSLHDELDDGLRARCARSSTTSCDRNSPSSPAALLGVAHRRALRRARARRAVRRAGARGWAAEARALRRRGGPRATSCSASPSRR